jgi:hypothetical protein
MPVSNDVDMIASVINDWWYYSVELAPGVVTKGTHSPRTPMLPRMLMRNCNLRGQACLDIGSNGGSDAHAHGSPGRPQGTGY